MASTGGVDVLPRALVADELGLVQRVEWLGQSIVVGIPLRAYRGDCLAVGQGGPVVNGPVLHPTVGVVHQARQVSTGSFPLPDGHLKGIQPQEGRQIRAGEGSLRHVEVSQVACVAAPIIRGPRPLPGVTTHPPHLYTSIGSSYHTLKHEEPDSPDTTSSPTLADMAQPQSRPATTRPLLDIIVIHHPESLHGNQVFIRLRDHYHSPAFAGLVGGSVEVYHRSIPWSSTDPQSAPRPVPAADSHPLAAQITVVIPVIDTSLIRATTTVGTPWSLYLNDALKTFDNDTSRRLVIPVIINPAFPTHGPLADLLNNTQGIHVSAAHLAIPNHSTSIDEEDETTTWIDHLFLEREISQAIVQHISPDWSIDHPLKVFISHTKKETSGEEDVTDIVKKIIATTHLDSFFDERSIQTGDKWKEALQDNASNCALLMIRTDLYASRLWTQKEVLLAKEHDVPVVTLSALARGEERGSFLMDHVPTVAFSSADTDSSVARALCRLVDEALKRTLWELQALYTSDTGFDWKPVHAPEPTTVTTWLKNHPRDDRHLWIIHPDPPLTSHEKNLIRDMCELAGFKRNDASLTIVTPREFLSRGGALLPGQDPLIEAGERSLNGRRLGISVSPSEDLKRLGLSDSHLDYAVAELAQLTFLHGGTLVYGGRINQDAHDMTTFMAEQAERYADTPNSFENLQPWCVYLTATEQDLRAFEDRIANVGSLQIVFTDQKLSLTEAAQQRVASNRCDDSDKMKSLTDMRQLAASTTHARVLIGGSLERSTYAQVPGTLQEVYLQLRAHRPVYICGGFGGIGAVVADAVGLPTPDDYTVTIPDITPEAVDMLNFIRENWRNIDTGLTNAEQADLAMSHHPSMIAGLILRGMNRLVNNSPQDSRGDSRGIE